MSSPIAKSQLAFQLPLLSYVDAHQEELELGTPVQSRKSGGILALIAAFNAWREKRSAWASASHALIWGAATAELSMMTDRELSDIGFPRSDLGRVFDTCFSEPPTERRRPPDVAAATEAVTA